MDINESNLYNKFISYKLENEYKFYRYNVLVNEHPYYERMFFTIIKNCADELTKNIDSSPHNIIPQEMYLIHNRFGTIVNCRFPDFIDYHKKVIIEIDGRYHNSEEQKKRDIETENIYKAGGFTVYRLKNEEVAEKAYKLLKKIYKV